MKILYAEAQLYLCSYSTAAKVNGAFSSGHFEIYLYRDGNRGRDAVLETDYGKTRTNTELLHVNYSASIRTLTFIFTLILRRIKIRNMRSCLGCQKGPENWQWESRIKYLALAESPLLPFFKMMLFFFYLGYFFPLGYDCFNYPTPTSPLVLWCKIIPQDAIVFLFYIIDTLISMQGSSTTLTR